MSAGYCPFVSSYVYVLKRADGSNFISEKEAILVPCVESDACKCWGGSDCGLKASNLQTYMAAKDTENKTTEEEKAKEEEAATKAEESDIPDIPYYVPLINEFMGNEDRDENEKKYGRDFKITDDDEKPIALKGLEEHPDWVEPSETITWSDYIASIAAIKAEKKKKAEEEAKKEETPTESEGTKYKSVRILGGPRGWAGSYDGYGTLRQIIVNLELFEKPDFSGENLCRGISNSQIWVNSECIRTSGYKENAIDGKDDTQWDSGVDTESAYYAIIFNEPKSIRSMRIKGGIAEDYTMRGILLWKTLIIEASTGAALDMGSFTKLGEFNTEDTTDTQSFTW